jgi:hypothetical protein
MSDPDSDLAKWYRSARIRIHKTVFYRSEIVHAVVVEGSFALLELGSLRVTLFGLSVVTLARYILLSCVNLKCSGKFSGDYVFCQLLLQSDIYTSWVQAWPSAAVAVRLSIFLVSLVTAASFFGSCCSQASLFFAESLFPAVPLLAGIAHCICCHQKVIYFVVSLVTASFFWQQLQSG